MLDASTSASNSSSEICGEDYLYVLPTESLDVPELPLVNCVWILRVRKHHVGWDKGLDSLRSSYLGLHGGVQVLETCLTPVACHLLPSLFWPAFYELIVRWFSHLESSPPYYTRRGCVREGRPPLKEQSLHELTLHTNWTHVVLLPSNPFSSLFCFFLPCLGVTCSSVARYRTVYFWSVSPSLCIYPLSDCTLPLGLLSWWAPTYVFTLFKSEKASLFRVLVTNEKWAVIFWGK